MKRLKRKIGSIYMCYLMRKGVSMEELYNKTKSFFVEEQKYGYWKKIKGVWRYVYGDRTY